MTMPDPEARPAQSVRKPGENEHAELERLARAAEADNDNPDYFAAVRSLEAFNSAATPTAILAMIEENRALRGALEFYAADGLQPNEGPWGVNSNDFGTRAHQALQHSQGEER